MKILKQGIIEEHIGECSKCGQIQSCENKEIDCLSFDGNRLVYLIDCENCKENIFVYPITSIEGQKIKEKV